MLDAVRSERNVYKKTLMEAQTEVEVFYVYFSPMFPFFIAKSFLTLYVALGIQTEADCSHATSEAAADRNPRKRT